jgi:O-methyltransferase
MFQRLVRRSQAGEPVRHVYDGPIELRDLDERDREIVGNAMPHTLTGVARIVALVDAVRYCVHNEVPGAFAECGVWRGGSVLAMILTLQDLGLSDRDLYLFDTFTGPTEPTEDDVSGRQEPALKTWRRYQERNATPWGEAFHPTIFNEEIVRRTVTSTGYPVERLHFVAGRVEETVPDRAPEQLAILRLDTDFYASTRHEMVHLYPRLVRGGVLIVDDYGHWQGARRAVDEHLAAQATAPLLTWIDYTAKIGVKP